MFRWSRLCWSAFHSRAWKQVRGRSWSLTASARLQSRRGSPRLSRVVAPLVERRFWSSGLLVRLCPARDQSCLRSSAIDRPLTRRSDAQPATTRRNHVGRIAKSRSDSVSVKIRALVFASGMAPRNETVEVCNPRSRAKFIIRRNKESSFLKVPSATLTVIPSRRG